MQWRENIKNIQLSFDVLLDKTHLYNMTPKIRHSLFFYYARCAAVEWIFLIPNSMLSPVEKSLVSILHSNTTEELVLCIRLKLGEAHLAPISSSRVLSLPRPALAPFISRSILYHNTQRQHCPSWRNRCLSHSPKQISSGCDICLISS